MAITSAVLFFCCVISFAFTEPPCCKKFNPPASYLVTVGPNCTLSCTYDDDVVILDEYGEFSSEHVRSYENYTLTLKQDLKIFCKRECPASGESKSQSCSDPCDSEPFLQPQDPISPSFNYWDLDAITIISICIGIGIFIFFGIAAVGCMMYKRKQKRRATNPSTNHNPAERDPLGEEEEV